VSSALLIPPAGQIGNAVPPEVAADYTLEIGRPKIASPNQSTLQAGRLCSRHVGFDVIPDHEDLVRWNAQLFHRCHKEGTGGFAKYERVASGRMFQGNRQTVRHP